MLRLHVNTVPFYIRDLSMEFCIQGGSKGQICARISI